MEYESRLVKGTPKLQAELVEAAMGLGYRIGLLASVRYAEEIVEALLESGKLDEATGAIKVIDMIKYMATK